MSSAGLDSDSRQALFAHCVGLTINATCQPYDRRPKAIAHADRLAEAVQLDMAEAGWRPTVATYLGRVTKARILEAVREAKGEQAAQLIEDLKKADMAREAERLLDGTGWLPEPLRTPDQGFPACRRRRTGDRAGHGLSEAPLRDVRDRERRSGRRSAARRRIALSPSLDPRARRDRDPPRSLLRRATRRAPFLFGGPLMPDTLSDLARRLAARSRGGLPPLPVQRPPPWALLAGRRCAQHAGPQPLRAPARAERGKGAAGQWTDAATGEHGDLLDLIAA